MYPFQNAKRIWRAHNGEPNQYALFDVSFAKADRAATLFIRADNRYFATLNGKEILAQQYSDYPHHPTYDAIEIDAAALSRGENRLQILAYCQNEDSSTYRTGEPSLIFELIDRDGRSLIASGADTPVTADTGYVSGPVEKISPQLSYSFRYDAALADAPTFAPPILLSDIDVYHPRPIPQLSIGAPVHPSVVSVGTFFSASASTGGLRVMGDRLIPTNRAPLDLPLTFRGGSGDGIYLTIDFGAETVGLPLLEITTSARVQIDVAFGEHIEDGRVRAVIGDRDFTFSVKTRVGHQRLFFPIKRYACRYLELHVRTTAFTLHYAGLRPVEYPFVEQTPPPLNTPADERLYRASLRTLRCCAHEHYEDGPWREQALYALDSRNQMLFGYDAFGETRLAREGLRLLALGQREDGLLELCAPARVPVNIPSFSLIWIHALSEYVARTKDADLLREMLPIAERILAFFAADEESGLIRTPRGYWNYYEWSEGLNGEGKDELSHPLLLEAPLQAFYALALLAMASMTEDARYTERHRLLRESYARGFYDAEKDGYRLSNVRRDTPELVQILTARAELCSDAAEKSRLLDRIGTGAFLPAVTLSHRIFYYEALLDEDNAAARMLDDVRRHYLTMVERGATTLYETEEGAAAFDGAGSLCHGWSAAPVYVYFRIAEQTSPPRQMRRISSDKI